MAQQKRYDVYRRADLWPDGAEARTPPEGTVEQGALAAEAALADPPPVDAALLQRGRERYEAICTPCHGLTGHGDGMIVARGFPRPPSYHDDRLRAAPARYLVDVITNGYGVMYRYANRVAPQDRWAIAAYIRALQLSQGARVAEVPGLAERLPGTDAPGERP
ncbi:c-type cytochrome [Methylobacterium nonmethylotrophicum]|uniref:Cytochrome c n=1 Tax=Methylobacterium nonmethylotrophicum TaxID=1141884 RepID=A0A4Z0NF64_9HYPH|nr:cytochrome c [Methylobacterium nonmethylotrophicum]TGD94867.1 cytochrome c [Methylobacterium nonmethylotrophicum]